MKRFLLSTVILFCLCFGVFAQNNLNWGTYYSGTGQTHPNGEDKATAVATDPSGNVYMVGSTNSRVGIATPGAHQVLYGNIVGHVGGKLDAFVAKFDANGVRLWATYYGGTEDDWGISCTVDGSGNVYLLGLTNSTSGIATAGAHETTLKGSFLVKFNSNGIRQWGTYMEGIGEGCTSDLSGNIYAVGYTNSNSGIATAGSSQPVMVGTADAFLVKFNTQGVKQWGTYYGGISANTFDIERGISCVTDNLGNVYMTGETQSTSGLATTGAAQTSYGGGFRDAFLVKFNTNGVKQWSTYVGGLGIEKGNSCAVDASNNVYVSGDAQQSNGTASGLSTIGTHQSAYGGGYSDAFLVKFNSNGVKQWGTYYGGSQLDVAFSCATDVLGNVFVSGETQSETGIATGDAHQTNQDMAFLVKFNSSGMRLSGTYFTGIRNVCTTDPSGNLYMAGYTKSSFGIATPGAHQMVYGGGNMHDAFLVKFRGISADTKEEFHDGIIGLYPNPASKFINLEVFENFVGVDYQIMDYSGKIIFSGTIESATTFFDLGTLETGVYWINVGRKLSRPFVIIKNKLN